MHRLCLERHAAVRSSWICRACSGATPRSGTARSLGVGPSAPRPIARSTYDSIAASRRRYSQPALQEVDSYGDDVGLSYSAFPQEQPNDRDLHVRNRPIGLDTKRSDDLVRLPTPRKREGETQRKKVSGARVRSRHDTAALFDACVATGNLLRARSLLDQLRHLADNDLTRRCANRLLQELVDKVQTKDDFDDADKLFRTFPQSWRVGQDKVSYALMCKAALRLEEPLRDEAIRTLARDWQFGSADFGEVLAVTDVLSRTDVQLVFDIAGLDVRQLGKEFRNLVGKVEHPLREIPELLPTRQRGAGLTHVKHSLQALTDVDAVIRASAADFEAGGDQLAFNLARQRMLEDHAVESAMLRWQHDHEAAIKRGGLSFQKSLNATFWRWKEDMVPLIQEEIDRIDHSAADRNKSKYTARPKSATGGDEFVRDEQQAAYNDLTQGLETDTSERARREYGPLLELLKPEKMAAITILETIRAFSTEDADGLKSSALVLKIGRALEMEHQSELLKRRGVAEKLGLDYKSIVQSEKLFNMSVRRAQARSLLAKDSGLFVTNWSQPQLAQIGGLMLSFLVHVGRMEMRITDAHGVEHVQTAPAFYHAYQYARGQRLGVVKAGDDLMYRLCQEPLKGSIYPRLLPMLTLPKPWYAHNSGGYLYTKILAMRCKVPGGEQIEYFKAACEKGRLDAVLAGLDVLGQTPWKINARVFQCALMAWNSGKAFADIPPAEINIDVPAPPIGDIDPAARLRYMEELKAAAASVRNCASVRSDCNYKLEIARAFLKDTMYFPHSLDFRGRAYPVPPHFNHLGNDLCRGLLKFADARPLGKSGLRWLKIHFANQCGYDKASFDEREAYADERIEQIYEACDHPMEGTQWWVKTDNPWQCLAACIELAEALRSPNAEEFMSSLPVHQDGTCNGLQHYAALGGDLLGAKQVNLEPSDRPQDVYRGVADIVASIVESDADGGNVHAQALRGRITRKVVKQTVMTNVYGVTFVGARLQIENQLKALGVFAERDAWAHANYLAQRVFKALQTMFTGAHEIQDWLKETSIRITRSVHRSALLDGARDPMTAVIWTTPLDMPVVQPYRNDQKKQIETNLQTVYLSDPSDSAEVNSRKQSSAFPPNFIHSLDATHMLMSALVCRAQGVAFAAVHDSYWTHAADTDTMNVILRDAFIKLHSGDLMTKLKEEFELRYRDHFSPQSETFASSEQVAFATRQEHIDAGKVRIIEKPRAVVVLDRELAKQVLALDPRARPVGVVIDEQADRAEVDESEPVEVDGKTARQTRLQSAAAGNKRPRDAPLWTPFVTFGLPQKGDFDVSKLKQSKYFFS